MTFQGGLNHSQMAGLSRAASYGGSVSFFLACGKWGAGLKEPLAQQGFLHVSFVPKKRVGAFLGVGWAPRIRAKEINMTVICKSIVCLQATDIN